MKGEPHGQPLILLADESEPTRRFLHHELTQDGFRVAAADTRESALRLLAVHQPRLILADLNGQTLALLDAVRNPERLDGAVDPDTPVLVLSSRSDELGRVRVFDHGGDDVVSKPFSYLELRGRIRALLRRSEPRSERARRQIGPLRIDLASRQVTLGGQPVTLTVKEYELLVALTEDPHRVLTRQELLGHVWGYRTASRTLDTHACRLRHKLAAHPQPVIITVRGVGYRFCDPLGER